MNQLTVLPCLDNEEMAASRRRELDVPWDFAAALGKSAVDAADQGRYVSENGNEVAWEDAVQGAIRAKLSIPPERSLPRGACTCIAETVVQVSNETTLGARDDWLNADYGRWP